MQLLAAPQVGPQRDLPGPRASVTKDGIAGLPAVNRVPGDGQTMVANSGVVAAETIAPVPYALEQVQYATEQMKFVEPMSYAVEQVTPSPLQPGTPLSSQFVKPLSLQASPPIAVSQQLQPGVLTSRSISVPKAVPPTGYTVVQQRAAPMSPAVPMVAPGGVDASNMVAMPASVLQHIDSVVTEMEKELSEIRAYEQRQEACESRQAHLREIRQLVAERLLSTGEEEAELRQVRAEVGRLSMLEADHLALKRQVLDLEQQRSTAEREREELLRIRAALEAECEARLNELRTAADAVEHEKRRAQLAEESANERVRQAAMEARTLQEKLLEAESITERERRMCSEAMEAQTASDRDLRALEGTSAAVLNDCRSLQMKIKELQGERDEGKKRVLELESEIGISREFQSQAEQYRARSAELELKLADMEGSLREAHARRKGLDDNIDMHLNRIGELERSLNEKNAALLAAEDGHAQKHQATRGRINTLERSLAEVESDQGAKDRQLAANRTRILELEQELLTVAATMDSQAKQNTSFKQKIAELEQLLSDAQAADTTHTRQHHTHRTRIQELEAELLAATGEKDNHGRQNAQHRSRITELERLLEEMRLAEGGHNRAHTTNKARIAELERLLEEAMTAEGQHTKHHNTHRSKITELEVQVQEMVVANENQVRQNATLRQRVAELERELEMLQAAEANHHRQHGTNRTKIQELEQVISEKERAFESQIQAEQRKGQSHKDRMSELEKALETAEGGARKQGIHAKRAAELEALLEEAQGEHGRLRNQHAARQQQLEQEYQQKVLDFQKEITKLNGSHGEKHQQNEGKILALERDLANIQQQHDEKKRRHDAMMGRVADLEGQLEAKDKQMEQHINESEAHRKRVEELHKKNVGREGLEDRVATLEEELTSERHQLAIAMAEIEELKTSNANLELKRNDIRGELEVVKVTMSEMESQLVQKERSIRELEVLKDRAIRDQEGQILQRDRTISELEERLARREKKKTVQRSMIVESAQTSVRQSFQAELKLQLRDVPVAPLLPGSTDSFVMKVREATKMVGEALKAANAAHVATIDSQIKSAIEAQSNGRDVRASLRDYKNRLEIESERRAAADQVEAATHDLKALMEELAIQHQLSRADNQEIATRLELDVSKCTDELLLLRNESALADLPDMALQMMLDIQAEGPMKAWEDGFSPMHWAAKNGRRDIMEYLLNIRDGNAMLAQSDKFGRSPLMYAQDAQRQRLTRWLQDEVVNVQGPRQEYGQGQLPQIADLPEPYLRVLQQIWQFGWASMNWRDGFTMLHWAANKGRADVCKFLSEPPINADLRARDAQGRTPADVAREAGKIEIAALLQRLEEGRPT